MPSNPILIKRFLDLPGKEHGAARAGIEDICVQGARAPFVSANDKRIFLHTWINAYFQSAVEHVWIASRARDAAIVGYLVGACSPPDHAHGLPGQFHVSVFRDLWRAFPAHLHINVTATARGHGVGGALIRAFLEDLRCRKIAGVHIVTVDGARNATFYRRAGFTVEHARSALERNLVFMGQHLAEPPMYTSGTQRR
ncbi:MAG: GNAT family N-acetyltransferase [Pseudomonadota bacterium]